MITKSNRYKNKILRVKNVEKCRKVYERND